MEIHTLLRQGEEMLTLRGVPDAGLDVQLLLGHCLGMSRTELFLHGTRQVDESTCRRYLVLVERRARREPLAYILGEREFWSLPFGVTSAVLIPRPETEFLLETVFSRIAASGMAVGECVDLCCGSGVIAVVLALELKCHVWALDCSPGALAVARENSIRHNVEHLVRPLESDLLQGLPQDSLFPLIVSNPPYVSRGEIEHLEPEVARHEPLLALDGGADGLDCIRRIAGQVLDHLAPGGMFFMEFGAAQGPDVRRIFSSVSRGARFFATIDILKDYSGRDRVLAAQANTQHE